MLRHIDVGSLVKKNGFHKSYDEEWETYEVDEDQLLDHLEPMTGGTAPDPLEEDPAGSNDAREVGDDEDTRGGLVLDWHTCDVWPERWADLVIVLRCDHQILWKRLEKRLVFLADLLAATQRRRSLRTMKRKLWVSWLMMLQTLMRRSLLSHSPVRMLKRWNPTWKG